jgi:hypothetical protein
VTTDARKGDDAETEPALIARRHQLATDLQTVDRHLVQLRASRWTVIEAKDGSRTVQHTAGERRYTGFTEGEARVVAAALNQLRRVRIMRDVLVRGQPVSAGAEFDLPQSEAWTFVLAKQAVFVP